VHLNLPLREPLVPPSVLPAEEPGGGGRGDGRPWLGQLPAASDGATAASALAPLVAAAPRGVVVVGRSERPHVRPGVAVPLARTARAFSEATGWPVLADPLSGARGAGSVAHYDALLRAPAFASAAAPRAVLRAGDLPTSKPLRDWLAGLDAVQVLIDPEDGWQDPAGVCDLRVDADPATLLRALAEQHGQAPDTAWADAWANADARAGAAIAKRLGDELSEPRIAAELGAALPQDATLVVASSMPIRDLETLLPAREVPLRVLSNRGANGIDGTIATAYGVAAASPGPVVLLTGDVALAHDVGAFLTATRMGVPLTIVLVDNGGGGIFDFLPAAGSGEAYETHIATPATSSPGGVAQAFGLHLLPVDDLRGLRAAVDYGLGSDGTQIVHARTDRAENVALHAALWDDVAQALARDA
jgi:2-succinyl-5-enolpyruvyl-6-hydroxy-3-cyclohexene-1-carboxylate synthase